MNGRCQCTSSRSWAPTTRPLRSCTSWTALPATRCVSCRQAATAALTLLLLLLLSLSSVLMLRFLCLGAHAQRLLRQEHLTGGYVLPAPAWAALGITDYGFTIINANATHFVHEFHFARNGTVADSVVVRRRIDE